MAIIYVEDCSSTSRRPHPFAWYVASGLIEQDSQEGKTGLASDAQGEM